MKAILEFDLPEEDREHLVAAHAMHLKIIAFALLVVFASTQVEALSFKGKVVGVSDGDTISVLYEGKPEKIRLNGIDCPEKKQAFGTRAKQFTSEAIFGKKVEVQYDKRDRYGRILGNVLVDGKDLSESLLRGGMAWHYKQFSKSPRLQGLEDAARSLRVGLWQDKEPVPPWEFRRKKK